MSTRMPLRELLGHVALGNDNPNPCKVILQVFEKDRCTRGKNAKAQQQPIPTS
jgi:hypothetical protein